MDRKKQPLSLRIFKAAPIVLLPPILLPSLLVLSLFVICQGFLAALEHDKSVV